MSTDISIEIENISKSFNLQGKKSRFKGVRKTNSDKIFTLENISFQVKKGEVLGIIGLNASGKTTLLRLISGIYNLDSGKIQVNGVVAPILHIGTGFHMEMNASENIIIYGMLMGLSHSQIKEKTNSIIEFAGLKNFEELKLKKYSSGMRARLAFSSAMHVNADIILIDEVLAVGDAKFKEKSFKEILEFKNKGKTILFTTHNVRQIAELSDRVLLLDHGKLIKIGNPEEVIKKYDEIVKAKS